MTSEHSTPDPEASPKADDRPLPPRRFLFRKRLQRKLTRHHKAQRQQQALWFGLGVFGVVGWSVALPTLLGIALGLWIDRTWPSRYSWTLTLLFAGVMVGCANAWYWVESSHRQD